MKRGRPAKDPAAARLRAGGGARWMRLRALALAGVTLALFGVVLARAAWVQLLDHSRMQRQARNQSRREVELSPRRGLITDRRGDPLAVTQDVDSVFADPSAFADPALRADAAKKLSGALRVSAKKLERKLAHEGKFVWLKRRIEPAMARRVSALGLDGVELVQEPKRFYPQRELAGHVLGFVGEEAGQEGLERELDQVLRGKSVTVSAVRDAHGATVLAQGGADPAQLTGATVTLTLDTAIQLATERELHQAVESAGATGGWAVVMDVQTGALLSLAGSPAFDANKPGRDPEVWKNRAVQDALEPGSTIKSFIVARAIEEGLIEPHTEIFCEEGAWRRGRRTIHDTHKHGWLTPAGILRESSNIGAAKIAELLGAERLVSRLRSFGFGERTGVGLPGEARGQLRPPGKMKPIELYTTGFGQGMSATGLQTVAAMAAIANGGVLLRPYLVEKVVAPDGTVLVERKRQEVRRVLSPRTAQLVTEMLEEVTRKGGTGTKAAIADFRVAGKTGTAQKVDLIAGGYGEKRLSSFLGFVPAEAPRLAILVAIDEPEDKATGGVVAAPAWGRIAAEALRQLDVHPERLRERADEVAVAGLGPAGAGARGSESEGGDGNGNGNGSENGSGSGSENGKWNGGEMARGPVIPAGKSVVPDLRGLAARSAIRRLAESELEPELRGSGRAVSQHPRAGSVVKRGARVRVTLAPPG